MIPHQNEPVVRFRGRQVPEQPPQHPETVIPPGPRFKKRGNYSTSYHCGIQHSIAYQAGSKNLGVERVTGRQEA